MLLLKLIVHGVLTVYLNLLELLMTLELRVLLARKLMLLINGIVTFNIVNIIITIIADRCLNDCSGNGTCAFIDLNTGNSISSCNILSTTCSSKCICING